MRGPIYTPGMKTKRGEMKALRELAPAAASRILPLIDVLAVPDGENGERVKQHVEKHLQHFAGAWPSERPFYLDLFDVGSGFRGPRGIHPVRLAYQFVRQKGFDPIPVVGLDRDSAYLRAIREEVSEGADGICVRLLEEDLRDPRASMSGVERLLTAMASVGLERHALLDFRGIEHKRRESIRDRAEGMYRELVRGGFARIVFLASGMPASMGGVARNSITRVARTEFSIWRELMVRTGRMFYGDYGVVHPDFVDLDPRVIHPAAKIRYSTSQHWVIAKGVQWISNTRQHRGLANKIMGEQEYRRAANGWGERYLRECARGRASCGTLETWVTVDTHVHLEFALRQVHRELIGVVPEESSQ